MSNKTNRFIAVSAVSLIIAVAVAGCGSDKGGLSSGSAGSSYVAPPTAVITCSAADIDYQNIYFDYTEAIATQKAEAVVVPEPAAIDLRVSDEKGATGAAIIPSQDASNTEDYYLSVLVAENALTFTGGIASAQSSVSGELSVNEGTVSYVPAPIDLGEAADEILTFTMASGAVYKVHTIPEAFPDLTITGTGVSADNAGVYTLDLDKYLIRVGTDRNLVYYRNLNCTTAPSASNFTPYDLDGKQYYAYSLDLNVELRAASGGYNSAMYVVMDENYVEIDWVTLHANDDPNYTHGEGYLDGHDFLVMGEDHYLLLSYTGLLVENLPESVEGIDGGSSAYVWAGIIQEVKDGKVVGEINTTDYPLLYESAVECINYAGSTDKGVNTRVGVEEFFSIADGYMDYVHINSIDYTLEEDGTADKVLVSMRDQSAVYQFDFDTGAIDWILGGKASTLSGFDEYTTTRADDNGAVFQALTFGQHHARYTNKAEDGTISGNPEISVFDNQTGAAPYLMSLDPPTLTRTFMATIDEKAQTADIFAVIEGTHLNEKTDRYHIADHCGSVIYGAPDSVTIGWGGSVVIDGIGPMVPEGTIKDTGFDDLRQGSRPIISEYDPIADEITFELYGIRNPIATNTGPFFAYRTYKTAR